MKVYIAAPFFTPEQLEIVKELEAALRISEIEFYSPRSEGTLVDMTIEDQKKSRKRIFDLNVWNMDNCSHMIACVEYKDTGTIFEMGYFCGIERPIYMMSSDLSKVNVMLAESAEGIGSSPEHAVDVLLGLDVGAEVGSYT